MENKRMSARFFASRLGVSTSKIYELWERLGLVEKNEHGTYVLTELGKLKGGRGSQGNGTPTFEWDAIKPMMDVEIYKKL